jgi:hypothetical protein
VLPVVSDAKVSVLLPVPDMRIFPAKLSMVKAPAVSEEPAAAPRKSSVPPLKVIARPAMRPPVALPAVLSNRNVPGPCTAIEEAALRRPSAPLNVTKPWLTVTAPVIVLLPVKESVPVPE